MAEHPLQRLSDGTVKQVSPLTGTTVWTVPGRGHRPLPGTPAQRRPVAPGEADALCAFCTTRYRETPPEKARLVLDPQPRVVRHVAAADLRPGDFFVMPGSPGHAVLVLDLARSPDGRRRAVLGQGFMPAQSFHVLRGASGSAWFAVDEAQATVAMPFWEPFPWATLRRLDGAG